MEKPEQDALELLRHWRAAQGWVGSGPKPGAHRSYSGMESYAEQGEYRLVCSKCHRFFLYRGFKASAYRWHQDWKGKGKWEVCGPLNVFQVLEDLTRERPADE